jgi:hypothetical protein
MLALIRAPACAQYSEATPGRSPTIMPNLVGIGTTGLKSIKNKDAYNHIILCARMHSQWAGVPCSRDTVGVAQHTKFPRMYEYVIFSALA